MTLVPKEVSGAESAESRSWTDVVQAMGELEHRIINCPENDVELMAELRNKVCVIQERSAELRKEIDRVFVNFIETSGPIIVGTCRYVIGTSRTTQCVSKTSVADIILAAVGGDWDRFCDQLVAQPFKSGSVSSLISKEMFDRFFRVTVRKDIKGETIKQLIQEREF